MARSLITNSVAIPTEQNLIIFSEKFSDASWTKINATVNTATDPLNGASAFSITDNAVNNVHGMTATLVIDPGLPVTMSCYAKKVNRDYIGIGGGGANVEVSMTWFNLANGTIGTRAGKGNLGSTIESIGNGWYRCSVTSYMTSTHQPFALACNIDASPVYAGNTTIACYVWRYSVVHGFYPQPYVKTTTVPINNGAMRVPVSNRIDISDRI